eukprot:m.30697 g.30697  ORF g.30697 m.30697 type:complete len:238 (+) comp9315_c0_seq2:331-1044(+)
MSRAHMLYDDKKLQPTATVNATWTAGPWLQAQFETGPGFLIEVSLESKHRVVITDSSGTKHRYMCIVAAATKAFRRQYDASGAEVQVIQQQSQKVRTGHLHSSYEKRHVRSDVIPLSECKSAIQSTFEKLKLPFASDSSSTVEFLVLDQDVSSLDLYKGDPYRIVTRGDSPFLESLARLGDTSVTVTNFSGGLAGKEAVGESWTDKIMQATIPDKPLPGSDLQGVDSDEWDDDDEEE